MAARPLARAYHALATPGPWSFAVLTAIEGLARASLATVIPLLAFEVMGNARDVSALYTGVGWVALASTFAIPWLVRRFRVRRIYAFGAVLLIASTLCYATLSAPGWVAGQMMRLFAMSCATVGISLYIMAYIPKRQLGRSEPLRTFCSAFSWSLGPFLGVTLATDAGRGVAFAFSAACAALFLLYLFRLPLGDPLAGGATAHAAPWRNVRRFAVQPRLVLAWFLNFGREVWWVMFFIYAPIYMVQAGETPQTGALLISCGTAFLFITPVMGWIGRQVGLRRFFMALFAIAATATSGVAVLFDQPWVGAGLLLVSALTMVSLDAVCHIPFLRAVKARERPEMTMVFGTYRDMAGLIPTAIFTALLSFLPLPSVFAATGIALFGFAVLARWLPRGM
ncbi:MAG: MFS transporter [Alphaproteobacteria bacterium]|nr:MFS transporter [Alphaproteobacteria bacterium]